MKSQITDWLAYCENPKSFHSCDFFTLFMDDITGYIADDDAKIIFSRFPYADTLLHNFKCIRTIATETEKLNTPTASLINLAKADIEQKMIACELINEHEFAQGLKDLNYVFIDDSDEFRLIFKEDHIFSNFISNVSFFVNSNRAYKHDAFYGLEEALYGYTHDYQLIWHVLSPLIATKINFSFYYDFINRGGDYVITKRGVFVSRHGEL